MNHKKINELREKESEVKNKKIFLEIELPDKQQACERRNFKKNERPENKFVYWDLSGGLLGI